jgi:molybdate transport system regulatory protein
MVFMKPHVKLYLSSNDIEGVFGGGKWRLLDAIRREGSMYKAAESLGRSYRKVWGDIKRAEEGLGRTLVTKVRGGSSGGATLLTDFALTLLEAWDAYHSEVENAAKRSYKKLVAPVLTESGPTGKKSGRR